MLGKYAAAFAFSLVTGIVALSLAMLAVGPVQDLRFGPTWAFFAGLVALSCLAYAALYVLLGVIFVRRAMAVAVAYTFVFEFLVGFIPAMINQLTVQHHLRSLLLNWLGPSRETLEIRASSAPDLPGNTWPRCSRLPPPCSWPQPPSSTAASWSPSRKSEPRSSLYPTRVAAIAQFASPRGLRPCHLGIPETTIGARST